MRSHASWRRTCFIGCVLLCALIAMIVLPSLLGDPVSAVPTNWPQRLGIAAVLVALLLPIGIIVFDVVRVTRRQRRRDQRLCPACGYDIRASRDRCPECGAAVQPAQCPDE